MIPDRVGDKLFSRRARQGGIAERKTMIGRSHALPITLQAKALGISRGSVYYMPRVSIADPALMRRIDELHLDYPFAGSRMLQGFLLATEGHKIGRLHVRTLMKRMGIEAIYRRPNTSKPDPGHKIFPYLLHTLPVTRANQVWAMDMTYIPMARGFVYLAAIIDRAIQRTAPSVG